MTELTESQVRALAEALQLPMTAEDTTEVTHRLNAFIEALDPLIALPWVRSGDIGNNLVWGHG